MRTRPAAIALLVLCTGCSARRPRAEVGGLPPPPPPPPGTIRVYGPLVAENPVLVRSEIGWKRDLGEAERLSVYDVVLSQDRATCPADASITLENDGEGCPGLRTFPSTCTTEPRLRARVEVVVKWSVQLDPRCVGEANALALPATGDLRRPLTTALIGCFRGRNGMKPESSWSSLYEVTELRIGERATSVTAPFPRAIRTALHADPSPSFCRDDGAYLDGTAGRPARSTTPESLTIADLSARIAEPASNVPLTVATEANAAGAPSAPGKDWQTEHELWERCNDLAVRTNTVVQLRCLLLRQFDRFLRDIEDQARAETPRGTGAPPSAPAAASASQVPPR